MAAVMSLNLQYDNDRHGPWERRKRLIAEAARAAGADVLMLQAVRRYPSGSRAPDQAAQLAALSNGDYRLSRFEPAEERGDGGAEGNACVSRAPCRTFDSLRLRSEPGDEDPVRRMVLRGAFDWPEGRLTVLNAHFSWVESQARRNVDEALPFIRSTGGPAILVGDFNMRPDAEPLKKLRGLGWTDVWEALRPGEDGFTFESDAPVQRIDYVWASPGLEKHIRRIEVVRTQSIGARLSDHLGLCVRLAVPVEGRRA